MKLKLSLPHGKCFLIPEEIQAQMLTLISQCKIYTENGYSDYTYSPAEDLPEIAYVANEKINGYKEAMLEAQRNAQKADSERSTAQYKVYQADNKIKELEKAVEELKQNVIIAVPANFSDVGTEQSSASDEDNFF